MILAAFLEKSSLDRAPKRFADTLFVPKHAKADVLLTTVMGPLRSGLALTTRAALSGPIRVPGPCQPVPAN